MRKPALLCFATVAVLTATAPGARAADRAAAPAASAGPGALDPERQRALYLGIIESLRRDGSARAALAHLDFYDKQFPRDPHAQIVRADCLADIGDDAAADALYRKAAAGPYADQAQAGLGRLLAGRKDWTGAIAAFAEAVKRKPTRAAYLNDLGFALLQGGKADEGLFRLRQGLELSPNDVLIRNNLIVGLRQAGRGAEAQGLVEAIKSPVERDAAEDLLSTIAAPVAAPKPTPIAPAEGAAQ